MRWEKQKCLDGKEFWIVGERYFDEDLDDDVWTFMADVFIDKEENSSEILFDVFVLPRHIVEDLGWQKLEDGIKDLKGIVREMERIERASRELGLEVFSDEFMGFKTSYKMETADKGEIESKINELRESLGI